MAIKLGSRLGFSKVEFNLLYWWLGDSYGGGQGCEFACVDRDETKPWLQVEEAIVGRALIGGGIVSLVDDEK